jgi:hypothetical protein
LASVASLGLAWLGLAWLGLAWLGYVRLSFVWFGLVCLPRPPSLACSNFGEFAVIIRWRVNPPKNTWTKLGLRTHAALHGIQLGWRARPRGPIWFESRRAVRLGVAFAWRGRPGAERGSRRGCASRLRSWRARGDDVIRYDHTRVTTPDPIRTPQLSPRGLE